MKIRVIFVGESAGDFVWQMNGESGARNFRELLEEVVAVYGLDPYLAVEAVEGSVVRERRARWRRQRAVKRGSVALNGRRLGA